MYNINYTCIYNKKDIFLKEEEETLSEYDKDDVRDELYRQDFLNIFGLEEYDDKLIDAEIAKLYERIKECDYLENCIINAAVKFLTEDKLIGLMVLHSFCYLDASHKCISEFLETGLISNENMAILSGLLK
jgi:hypothetical protein